MRIYDAATAKLSMFNADWAGRVSKRIARAGEIFANVLFILASPVAVMIIIVALVKAVLRG